MTAGPHVAVSPVAAHPVRPERSRAARLSGPPLRVVASHGLAAIGMSLPWPLLLLLTWEATHDGLLLGLAGAARMLPYVLFSWAAGRLADRWRRDRVVQVTLAARVVLLLVVWAALAAGGTAIAVAAAALAVAVATPAYPALAAAMPDAAGPQSRRATDLLVTAEVASFVVGPALGGLLLAPATRALVAPAAVAMLVLAALCLAGIRLPRPTGTGAAAAPARVLPVLKGSARVRAAIAAIMLLNLVLAVVSLVLLPLAELAWREGGTAYGIATGALGFGCLAAPLLGRIARSDAGRVRRGLVLLGGCLLLVGAAPGLAWAAIPLTLAGAVGVQVESAATGVLQEHTPDRVRASILGLTDTAMVAAAMVGSLLAPSLAGWVGPHVLLGATAVLAVTGCLLVRRQPALTSSEPAVMATDSHDAPIQRHPSRSL